jgi:hypothetical protein
MTRSSASVSALGSAQASASGWAVVEEWLERASAAPLAPASPQAGCWGSVSVAEQPASCLAPAASASVAASERESASTAVALAAVASSGPVFCPSGEELASAWAGASPAWNAASSAELWGLVPVSSRRRSKMMGSFAAVPRRTTG